MGWLRKRLAEKSTYRGLAILASVAGFGLSPDMIEFILMGAAGALGFIEVVAKENDKELKEKLKETLKDELKEAIEKKLLS